MPDPVLPSKPWWTSKSLLGSVVVIIATALSWLGQGKAAEVVAEESGNITATLLAVVTMIGGVVALIGRIVAKTKITS